MINYLKSDQMNVVLNKYNKTQFRVIELKPIPSLSWANPSSAPACPSSFKISFSFWPIQFKISFSFWSTNFEGQIFYQKFRNSPRLTLSQYSTTSRLLKIQTNTSNLLQDYFEAGVRLPQDCVFKNYINNPLKTFTSATNQLNTIPERLYMKNYFKIYFELLKTTSSTQLSRYFILCCFEVTPTP